MTPSSDLSQKLRFCRKFFQWQNPGSLFLFPLQWGRETNVLSPKVPIFCRKWSQIDSHGLREIDLSILSHLNCEIHSSIVVAFLFRRWLKISLCTQRYQQSVEFGNAKQKYTVVWWLCRFKEGEGRNLKFAWNWDGRAIRLLKWCKWCRVIPLLSDIGKELE